MNSGQQLSWPWRWKIGANANVEEILEEECPLRPSYGLESDKVPKKEGMRPELIQDKNSVPMLQVVMTTQNHKEKIKDQAVTGAPRPVGMTKSTRIKKIKVQPGTGATTPVGTDKELRLHPTPWHQQSPRSLLQYMLGMRYPQPKKMDMSEVVWMFSMTQSA